MMSVTWRQVIFSVNSFCAAMLALYVSFVCDIERPYWAMMTAYITSQPFSGALHSKAIYRILGTCMGAAMMVLLVPPLSNAPILLSLAISVWIGFCLFVSLLDRTPRSYVFLLAGFTTAFVGFPIVGAPGTAFDVGVARVEEICIGVICATLFHTVFFPPSQSKMLARRFQDVITDLTVWCADTFARNKVARRRRGRMRLAADISDLHLTASHVPFDTHEPQQFGRVITILEDRLIRLFPLITGVSDRFKRLEALGPLPRKLTLLLSELNAWVAQENPAATAQVMQRKCENLQDIGQSPNWRDMLMFNIATRLSEFVVIYASCRETAKLSGSRKALRDLVPEKSAPRRLLHTDHRAALYSALVCTGISFFGVLLWILSGWTEGYMAALMGTVVYCLFAHLPNPVPAQRGALIYTSIASLAAAFYVFVIFPHVHDFVTLTIVLAPILLGVGILYAAPGGLKYLNIIVPFCGSLLLTRHFAPNFESFVNLNVAQFIGIGGALAATRIVQRFSAEQRIHSVSQAISHDISLIARGELAVTGSSWLSLMVDRVGLLAPFADVVKAHERYRSLNAMLDLRTGLNIIHLKESSAEIPKDQRFRVESLLISIGDHFHAQSKQDEIVLPPAKLLTMIDRELNAVAQFSAGRSKDRILNALTGLRCNLFPQAAELRA